MYPDSAGACGWGVHLPATSGGFAVPFERRRQPPVFFPGARHQRDVRRAPCRHQPARLSFWNGGLEPCVHFFSLCFANIFHCLWKMWRWGLGGRGLLNLSEPVRASDTWKHFAAQRSSYKEKASLNAKLRRLVVGWGLQIWSEEACRGGLRASQCGSSPWVGGLRWTCGWILGCVEGLFA